MTHISPRDHFAHRLHTGRKNPIRFPHPQLFNQNADSTSLFDVNGNSVGNGGYQSKLYSSTISDDIASLGVTSTDASSTVKTWGEAVVWVEKSLGLITYSSTDKQWEWVSGPQLYLTVAGLVVAGVAVGAIAAPELAADVAALEVLGYSTSIIADYGVTLTNIGRAIATVNGGISVFHDVYPDSGQATNWSAAAGDAIGTIGTVGLTFVNVFRLAGWVSALGNNYIQAAAGNVWADATAWGMPVMISYYTQIQNYTLTEAKTLSNAYFAALAQPIVEFNSQIQASSALQEAIINSACSAPNPSNVESSLSAQIAFTQEMMNDYRLMTYYEEVKLQALDTFFTDIGPFEPQVAVAIVYVTDYAKDLFYQYESVNNVFQTMIKMEQGNYGTILGDFAILQADPGNVTALDNLYSTISNDGEILSSLLGTLSQIVDASSEGADQNGAAGIITASSVSNGTITGTTGSDVLIGGATAVTFNGEGVSDQPEPGMVGQDVEIGNSGADIFLYDQGYGALEIEEQNPTGKASSAVLTFGSNITSSMVTVTANSSGGVVLTINDGDSGDVIVIDNQLEGTQYGVGSIDFTDGNVVWTAAQLDAMATQPTVPDSVIYGTVTGENYTDILSGDTVVGLGGGDSFNYKLGTGAVTIIEHDQSASPDNRIVLGAGITPADVTGLADSQGDLILTLKDGSTASGGDVVTIDGEFGSVGSGVESLVFSNGTTWTYAQLLSLGDTPTTGANYLYMSSSGTINGLGGGDTIHGSGGADTFIFDKGYGSLVIDENSNTGSASSAVLRLGSGLSTGSMTVTADTNGDLFLNFSATDIVELTGMLATDLDGVSQVIDSLGDTLTAGQILSLEENGAAGSLTIYGNTGTNDFTNLGRGDVVNAAGGIDTFNYSAGSGTVTINEAYAAGNTSVLNITGLTSQQATFSIISGTQNVEISDGTAGDAIILTSMEQNSTNGVAKIVFSNGTLTFNQVVGLAEGTLTVSGVGSSSSPLTGGSGSNIITATAADAYIVSSGIYDVITAKYGGSTINLESNSAGLAHNAKITLGGGHNEVTAVAGNVIITGLDGSDTITLNNGNSSVAGSGTDNVVSAQNGDTVISLGGTAAVSSNNTVSLLSGGSITLIGNSNQITLSSVSATSSTLYGGSTVSVSGTDNNVTAYAAYGEVMKDTSTSTATTFSLANAMGDTITALGAHDMVFVSGGVSVVNDSGAGTDLLLSEDSSGLDPDVVLTGFTADSTSLLTLAPDLGYTSLSGVLAALTSDGHGGSFLALGTGGSGIDFKSVSVSSLTAFLNSGTHIAFSG